MLSNCAENRHTLFRILSQAVHHWASPLGKPDGKGVPFNVLLCDRDEDEALLRQEIACAVHNTR